MNSPIRASVSPVSSPAPSSAKRPPPRVRLLLASSVALPSDLESALAQSPFPCVQVDVSLSGVALRRTDVIVVPRLEDLFACVAELEPKVRLGSPADKPSIMVLARPQGIPRRISERLDVTWIEPCDDAGLLAKRIAGRAGDTLVAKGVARRRSSKPNSMRAGMAGKANSKESVPSASVGRGEPAQGELPVSDREAMRSQRQAAAIRSIMPKALTIEGSRWLLLDDDVARAHAVAKALEAAGSEVVLSGTHPSESQLRRLRQFGAAGMLVEEASIDALSPLLQRLHRDPWLRAIGIVPVRWQQIYDAESQAVDLEALKLRVLPYWQPEHDLLDALGRGQSIPLAQLGPPRLLCAAARSKWCGDLMLESGAAQYTLTMNDGCLDSMCVNGLARLGNHASELTVLLGLEQGTATLRQRPFPSKLGACNVTLEAIVDASASLEIAPHPALAPAEREPPRLEQPALASHTPPTSRPSAPSQHARRWRPSTASVSSLCRSAHERWTALERSKRWLGLTTLALVGALVLLLGLHPHRAPASPSQSIRAPSTNPVGSGHDGSAASNDSRHVEASPNADSGSDPNTHAKPTSGEQGRYPMGCERWLVASNDRSASASGSLRNPVQARTNWYGARRAIHLGNWDRAKQLLCQSAELDPIGPGAVGLVELFLSRGNLEQAAEWGTWALTLQPKDSKTQQMLADVRNQQGRADEARALLHESMNVSAADRQVLRLAARNYAVAARKALRAQDPHQARRLFWRAHALDASAAIASAGLAELELRDGHRESALKWAIEAVGLDANCFEAQLALGDARAMNQELGLAKQAWLDAARLHPQSAEVRRRLGL